MGADLGWNGETCQDGKEIQGGGTLQKETAPWGLVQASLEVEALEPVLREVAFPSARTSHHFCLSVWVWATPPLGFSILAGLLLPWHDCKPTDHAF